MTVNMIITQSDIEASHKARAILVKLMPKTDTFEQVALLLAIEALDSKIENLSDTLSKLQRGNYGISR